jgi:hypothetical protein
MDNEHGELALELETLPDTDSEELGALIQRFRGELLDHGVDGVELSRRARRRRALWGVELLALGGPVVQFILQPEVLSGRRAVLAPAALGAERESSRSTPIPSRSWAAAPRSRTGSSSSGSLEMPPAADASQRRLASTVATSDYRDPTLHRLRAPGMNAEALSEVLGDPDIGRGQRIRR